ncbi:hypothetical protein [Anaeromicropila herbilytica]|uniref:Uncharacterized protein n=1 Tax=Anaeromicropila herbilytica TaxID=2785025 RepID=A0A7R7EK98_9FIRM|nr:hypothetical protein [Anaeromicropila herbilytica]BCN30269.1 hypothetical protein bsdtb5_15640 [Anaeromicropila herbilytica]
MEVNINFFDNMSVLKTFSKLYKLSENEIMRLAIETSVADNPTVEFIRKSGIKLDTVDIRNVTLHCKHITTINDNFDSLKKYGLLTLDKALTYPTPLNRFLLEHDISMDIVNRDIYYNNRRIHIIESDEECEDCFYGSECQEFVDFMGKPTTLSYRNMACDYRDEINIIRSKLYHDKCEIEVHLMGSFKDVHEYSVVRNYPEILMTIENLIIKLFKEGTHLQRDWQAQQNNKYYCIDFDINIFDFEFITKGKKLDYSDYCDCFEYNVEPIYDMSSASANFFGNVFIIQKGLGILRHEEPTDYGQILPETEIKFENLEINEFYM